MGKNFYLKMAASNLKRDKKMYIPFVIAYVTMVSIYFMVIVIMFSRGIADVPAGDELKTMFGVGMVVMTFLMILFMLYINSFLVKRRKKEFGLYGILGLEKRHVGKVIIWENIILSAVSILLGMVTGCIFSKLIFMLLFYSLKVSPNSRFDLPPEAFGITLILFSVIFVLTSIFNLLQVSLANPIDLLKGGNMGEKKVRFVFVKTLLGLCLLGWAYYEASSVSHAIRALSQFFFAVMEVIIATYLLFQAGSLFFLTVLKKNKKFYYKPNNFISISGMFYRMKQNAAGLASICILSTMVLVTVSTCTALYLGQEGMIKYKNPDDISISLNEKLNTEGFDNIIQKAKAVSEEHEIMLNDILYYNYSKTHALLKNGELIPIKDNPMGTDTSSMEYYEGYGQYIVDVCFISLKDYNRVNNTEETLGEQQVIILANKNLGVTNELKIPGNYQIAFIESDTGFTERKNASLSDTLFIVTENEKTQKDIKQIFVNRSDSVDGEEEIRSFLGFNLKNSKKADTAFDIAIKSAVLTDGTKGYSSRSIIYDRINGMGLFGGLLFLGVFFTIQFLAATILIIYFKQVSEGYEDKERFVILQKVGMDDLEVKRTINKQILLVFFLPLISALVHVAFARHMIIKLLELFYLYDVTLTTWCMAVTCIAFMVVYILVYRLTAKVYYKLVKW